MDFLPCREVRACPFEKRPVSDCLVTGSRLQRFLERRSGGVLVALLREHGPAEYAEQRGCVGIVRNPFGQLDHVVVTSHLEVKLGERDGGVCAWFETFDDVDRSGDVPAFLTQLCEQETNRVPIQWESRLDTVSNRHGAIRRAEVLTGEWMRGGIPSGVENHLQCGTRLLRIIVNREPKNRVRD